MLPNVRTTKWGRQLPNELETPQTIDNFSILLLVVVRVIALGSKACEPVHIGPPGCGLFPHATMAAVVKNCIVSAYFQKKSFYHGNFPEKRILGILQRHSNAQLFAQTHELTGAFICNVCALSLSFVQTRKMPIGLLSLRKVCGTLMPILPALVEVCLLLLKLFRRRVQNAPLK